METVLLVGQDSSQMDRLALTFQGFGYETIELESSTDAVDTILKNESIRLVILEEFMPVYNGHELCEMIRNEPNIPSKLPVVMMMREFNRSQKSGDVGITDILPYGPDAHIVQECAVRHIIGYGT